MIDLLVAVEPHAEEIRDLVVRHASALAIPHLLDVEVAQALRRLVRSGDLMVAAAGEALTALGDLPLRRYPHLPLMTRVFELRANVTAYDAVYLALAEGLDAELYTRDRRLARARGHGARVRVIG